MALCINGRYQEALYVMAVVCSTWSSMNAHTSQRDVLTPYGNTALSGVRAANRMVARWVMETIFTILYLFGPSYFIGSPCHKPYYMVVIISIISCFLFTTPCSPTVCRVALLAIFLQCLNQSWMIENPSGSSILLHPWLQWAIKLIQKAGGRAAFHNYGCKLFHIFLGLVTKVYP